MRVVVVGAGSIGLLIGSYLAQHKANVTFWVRREEQAIQLREGLIRLDSMGAHDHFAVRAVVAPEELPIDALWIIAVKYDALPEVLLSISTLKKQPDLLFVQNGIGHVSVIDQYQLTHVSFATVEHGAKRIDDRTVRHNGVGPITIAADERIDHMIRWLQCIDVEHFPINTHTNAEKLLLRKVIINCAINPLTAILQVRNGQLLDNVYFLQLFNQLCDELLSNFPEMEKELSYEDIASVCRRTASNQSSMLVDRLKGKPMEIETIVTAVLQKIEQRGGHAPFLKLLESMLYGINGSEAS
ncbi:ketopantoate reductase family protein [Sporosarcina obsidiansis]|uniref:ketopantoate reductase family protein n=1 Tax=Sporosarcina obsidiansis TaxID=2660748 RepID=UPI00129B0F62|nr:2-dehydropantoate 2-reductase [Sporosarcina obsidiansis]